MPRLVTKATDADFPKDTRNKKWNVNIQIVSEKTCTDLGITGQTSNVRLYKNKQICLKMTFLVTVEYYLANKVNEFEMCLLDLEKFL